MNCYVGRTHNPRHITCIKCEMEGAMTCQPALLKLQQVKRQRERQKPVPCPKEEREQEVLAQFLDLKFHGQWLHLPNEGRKHVAYHMKMKKQGLKKGAPDVLIFRPTCAFVGVAIELKRQRGGKVSPEQQEWLDMLSRAGWSARVCRGADDAIRFVREVYSI